MTSTSPFPLLFAPLALGPVQLPNRLVFPAHLTNLAVGNLPSPGHTAYYEARAAGGAGLIIMEDQSVHPTDWAYQKAIHAYRPEVVDGYRHITEAVHRHGARIVAQLGHNGAQGSSAYTGQPLWAPSPIADPHFRELPLAMEPRDIDALIEAFARSARHCADGGFDGVELQCSHSSILRAFLSPATNRRDDRWGGGLPARSRLLLQVVAAVRAQLGSRRALGVRLCLDEFVDAGLTVAEATDVALLLEESGQVDYLNTSLGVATASLEAVEPSMHVAPGYAMEAAATIRRAVRLPVIGVGRVRHPRHAEHALREGQCDLVGIVRGQIADPDFGRKARTGRAREIRACLSCNQECAGRVGKNLPIACVVNPLAGREHLPPVRTTVRRSREVLVVGAGPAGLQAALTAAEDGARVTVVDERQEPGGMLRHAARMPGRAEIGDLVRNQLLALRRLDVHVRTHTRADMGLLRSRPWHSVVMATGSRPVPPAWAGADDPRVIPLRSLAEGTREARGTVLVIDELGTHEATSAAELLAAQGCSVTLATPDFHVGRELAATLDTPGWRQRAEQYGIATRTAVVPVGTTPTGVQLLHFLTEEVTEQRADHVVLAAPELPEATLYHQAAAAGLPVTRAGDCIAHRRLHAAVLSGTQAAGEDLLESW